MGALISREEDGQAAYSSIHGLAGFPQGEVRACAQMIVRITNDTVS